MGGIDELGWASRGGLRNTKGLPFSASAGWFGRGMRNEMEWERVAPNGNAESNTTQLGSRSEMGCGAGEEGG